MKHKFKIRTAVEKVVEAESFEEVYDIAEVYMNRTKKLVLAAGLTLLGGTAAFGDFARGYFNNWANNCPLARPEGGNYYSAAPADSCSPSC